MQLDSLVREADDSVVQRMGLPSSRMFDRFTDEAKDAMNEARRAAVALGAGELNDLHMLVGCCRPSATLASRLLRDCGQDPKLIAERANTLARQSGAASKAGSTLPFSSLAKQVLERTFAEVDGLGHHEVGTHHFLLGMRTTSSPAGEILRGAGIQLDAARAVAHRIQQDLVRDREDALPEGDPVPPTNRQAQIKILVSAKDVCIELQQFELASQLRDLAHWLEHS